MSKKRLENAAIQVYVNGTVGSVAVEWVTVPTSSEVLRILSGTQSQRQSQFAQWILTWNWGVKQN
ncbi:hypothetical protein [Chryseolinea lacunae]|uniref:KTSC domain-containing protein n=1 Tax=Chryseolinea lacunae TaxID=2801331 RepID=A0ABS1KZ91_9BACT|nr:hypothetical protein [Chryseolinea lacunae]MBL0744552.1 hypothetical protein [Chryseolinea lacunae]